jgi:hypothetical protein
LCCGNLFWFGFSRFKYFMTWDLKTLNDWSGSDSNDFWLVCSKTAWNSWWWHQFLSLTRLQHFGHLLWLRNFLIQD